MDRRFFTGDFYHLVNRSIANFAIFRSTINCRRFIELLDYYNNLIVPLKYSLALQLKKYSYTNCLFPKEDALVKIIAYCLMPDHYHLLLKILVKKRLSFYIGNIENSYTRYFNLKLKRKGPLWQSRFKAIKIKTDEQLLHVSRYIHLNPVTSYLVQNPLDWDFSSYRDYVTNKKILSDYIKEISIENRENYKKFTENQIDYQRKLKKIKNLLLE